MDYVLLDEKNLKAAQVDKHVVESEEKMFGKYEGVYLQLSGSAERSVF